MGHINDMPRFKYTKHTNPNLIQKQYPLYLLLVSAWLSKYRVKTNHVNKDIFLDILIKSYRKILVPNNKFIKILKLLKIHKSLLGNVQKCQIYRHQVVAMTHKQMYLTNNTRKF